MLKYKRTHLPTGSVYIGDFNEHHDWRFSGNVVVSREALRAVAHRLINQWNAHRPENTVWRYELEAQDGNS